MVVTKGTFVATKLLRSSLFETGGTGWDLWKLGLPVEPTGFFLYPLKTSENLGRYRKRPVTWNGFYLTLV